MAFQRLVSIRIQDAKDIHPIIKERYSKFKHGCLASSRIYAGILACTIIQFLNDTKQTNKKILLLGAPYNKIPVASTTLTNFVLEHLSQQGLDVKTTSMSRQHSYHDDYGKMTIENREKSLSGETFKFRNLKKINEADLIFFIDDIYITGAHERRVLNIIRKNDLESKSIMTYFAKLEDSNIHPNLESKLNLKNVSTTQGRRNLLQNEVIPNTRVCKFFLKMSPKTIDKIVNGDILIKNRLKILAKEAEKNEYHIHQLYQKTYQHILNF